MYLAWYDDHPKKAVQYKITEAIDVYEDRFGERPNVVLVHESQVTDPVEGVSVVVRPYIRPHYFWVGFERPAEPKAAEER